MALFRDTVGELLLEDIKLHHYGYWLIHCVREQGQNTAVNVCFSAQCKARVSGKDDADVIWL